MDKRTKDYLKQHIWNIIQCILGAGCFALEWMAYHNYQGIQTSAPPVVPAGAGMTPHYFMPWYLWAGITALISSFIIPAILGMIRKRRVLSSAPPDEGAQGDPDLILVADASGDFSDDSNPSGPWAYGYYRGGLGGEFFRHQERPNQFRGVSIWGSSSIEASLEVMHHRSRHWIQGNAVTYAIPPDTILMHPGEKGSYVVVRWTCPQAGRYKIWYEFQGLDVQTTMADSDIDVRHNNLQSLCKDGKVNLNGIGSTIEHMSEVLDLRVRDTIDFVVGCGQGGFYGCDSTGLKAQIYQSRTDI
jgi:hypothetical protein